MLFLIVETHTASTNDAFVTRAILHKAANKHPQSFKTSRSFAANNMIHSTGPETLKVVRIAHRQRRNNVRRQKISNEWKSKNQKIKYFTWYHFDQSKYINLRQSSLCHTHYVHEKHIASSFTDHFILSLEIFVRNKSTHATTKINP